MFTSTVFESILIFHTFYSSTNSMEGKVKILAALNVRCPSCGLQGKPRDCPKCGRKACDKCIAVDNSDCMFCGPHGEIAKECFASYHSEASTT